MDYWNNPLDNILNNDKINSSISVGSICDQITKKFHDYEEKLSQLGDDIKKELQNELTEFRNQMSQCAIDAIKKFLEDLLGKNNTNDNLELLCNSLIVEFTKRIETDLFRGSYQVPILKIISREISFFSNASKITDVSEIIEELKNAIFDKNTNMGEALVNVISEFANDIANTIIGSEDETIKFLQKDYIFIDQLNLIKRNVIAYSKKFASLGLIKSNNIITINIQYDSLIDLRRLDYVTFKYYFINLCKTEDFLERDKECTILFNSICNNQQVNEIKTYNNIINHVKTIEESIKNINKRMDDICENLNITES